MAGKQEIRGYGLPAVVAARLVEVFARSPDADRAIVSRGAGGPIFGGYLHVRPDCGKDVPGTVIGVYGRDVTLQQLIDDIEVA